MSRGNSIIVTAEPGGLFEEGYITTAAKPGTVVQRDPSVALKGGRHTYVVFNGPQTGHPSGGALGILLEDFFQGRDATVAYDAGARCRIYFPRMGEEFNMLVANLAGTGDDHALGESLAPEDGTGLLVALVGTGEIAPFELLEAITDPTADTLAWVQFTGYRG